MNRFTKFMIELQFERQLFNWYGERYYITWVLARSSLTKEELDFINEMLIKYPKWYEWSEQHVKHYESMWGKKIYYDED